MKNKKPRFVGTISLNINTFDFNYGAMLHSWAFQKYMLKNNLCDNTEIINYITPSLERKHLKTPIVDAIIEKNLKSFLKNILIWNSYQKRYKKFNQFINNNMKISKDFYTQTKLENACLSYDTLICESDVIWSPGFFGGQFDKTFFFDLESMNEIKKVAYAPSLGDGNLSEQQKMELKKLLKNFDYISCRETYGVNILQGLTDKKIQKVLDPVMLLDDVDYEEIMGERIIKEDYLLLYLPVDNNKKLRESAVKYAKEKHLKILEISTKCFKCGNYKTLTSAGIEEFLSAIKYANTIFTNSFHAICFSLIFNKNFYAFARNYYGKIKDICDIVNLSSRFFENNEFKELDDIDYNSVNAIVNKLKLESKSWLQNALKSNN